MGTAIDGLWSFKTLPLHGSRGVLKKRSRSLPSLDSATIIVAPRRLLNYKRGEREVPRPNHCIKRRDFSLQVITLVVRQCGFGDAPRQVIDQPWSQGRDGPCAIRGPHLGTRPNKTVVSTPLID